MGLISRVSSRTYRTDCNPLKMPAPRNGEYVQVYGRKKTATAVALCKAGKGLIKVNGRPLDKIEPEALRLKLQEPLLVCGAERFSAIYQDQSQRWWTSCSNLRHPTSYQSSCCR